MVALGYSPPEKPNPKGPKVLFNDDVQNTLSDALISKYSAVLFGYYKDSYIKYFVSSYDRRCPLINRGYYSRVMAMRKVVTNFLDSSPPGPVQIVGLGAGFDTSFWNVAETMKTQELQKQLSRTLKWFEVDFPVVMSEKAAVITRNEELREELTNFEIHTYPQSRLTSSTAVPVVTSDQYVAIGADLTGNKAELTAVFEKWGFNRDLPTLFISECVLIYLDADQGNDIIRWASSMSNSIGVITSYQQIRPADNFGKVMLDHMDRKNCPLKSIYDFKEPHDQERRLQECGFTLATCEDMNFIYDHCLDKSDIMRMQRLELFDEIEEWRLIHGHYCISVGVVCSPEFDAYGRDLVSVWQPINIRELRLSGTDMCKALKESSLMDLASRYMEEQEEEERVNRLVKSQSYKSLQASADASESCSQSFVDLASLLLPQTSAKKPLMKGSATASASATLTTPHAPAPAPENS